MRVLARTGTMATNDELQGNSIRSPVMSQFLSLSVAHDSSVAANFSYLTTVHVLQIGPILQFAGREGIFHYELA